MLSLFTPLILVSTFIQTKSFQKDTPLYMHYSPQYKLVHVTPSRSWTLTYQEGATSSWKVLRQRQYNGTLQRSCLVAVTPMSHAVTRIPAPSTHWPTRTETPHAATAAEYNPCAPPYLFGGISLQCLDCLQNEGECSKWRMQKESIRYGHTFLSHHLRYLVLRAPHFVIYCGVVHFVTSVPVFTYTH